MRRRRKHEPEDSTETASVLALGIDWCSAVAMFWLGFWFWVFHWPYWTIMTAMLFAPPLALAALIATYAFVGFKDYRPFLPGLTILAPLVLLYGTLGRFNFLDGHSYDWALLVGAAVLIAPVYSLLKSVDPEREPWKVPPRIRVWIAAVAVFFALVYADGAVKLVDVALDTATAATYRTTVIGKDLDYPFLTRHRTYSADTALSLSPWGPDHIAGEVEVYGSELYYAVNVGGAACVRLHGGHMGLRWYEVQAC
jgi:hypothetical protein